MSSVLDRVHSMEWLVFTLSVVAAGIAFWQASEARAARKSAQKSSTESEAARDEARSLTLVANAAFLRQAAAQERANELAEAALPVPKISWTLSKISDSRYVMTNTGDLLARAVTVEGAGERPNKVMPEDSAARDLVPGDDVAFTILRSMGPRPRLRLNWIDELGEHRSVEREVR